MPGKLQRVSKHQGMGHVDVENGATMGATVGVNLFDANGNILSLEDMAGSAPPADTGDGVDQAAVDAAIAAHVAAADPHTQYLTEAEADVLYDGLGAASSSMAAHLLDPDPHPQYLEDAQSTAFGLTLLGAADAPAARVATDTFTTTIGSAPPASGNVSGDRWIDDADGTEYVYYDDGTSQQWVQFGSAVGNGPESGSSFPLSPATNRRFFRTDLGLDCYYDGTRWLTVNEYALSYSDTGTWSTSPSAIARYPMPATHQVYATRLAASFYINGTNTGAIYWNFDLGWVTAANVITSLATSTSQSLAPTTWHRWDATLNQALNLASVNVNIAGTRVGAPGNLLFNSTLYYRLIVT